MTEFIKIQDINWLEESPLYVMVAGGMGVGKSHVVMEADMGIINMDIDDTIAENDLEYTADGFAKAMELIGSRIELLYEQKISMVAMGTASNLPVSIDRLHMAKMNGYTTVLLYIDAPIEQATRQNTHRRDLGQRAVSIEEEYKIERSNIGAATTVAALKSTVLVDYYVHHMNYPKGVEK